MKTEIICGSNILKVSFNNVGFLFQPLFIDLSFQAVHDPLQAPQEYIDLYEDIEDIRRRRFAGSGRNFNFFKLKVFLWRDLFVTSALYKFYMFSHRSSGGSKGARGTPSFGPKFLHFRAVFGKNWSNNRLAPSPPPPPQRLVHPLWGGGNPGSTTATIF